MNTQITCMRCQKKKACQSKQLMYLRCVDVNYFIKVSLLDINNGYKLLYNCMDYSIILFSFPPKIFGEGQLLKLFYNDGSTYAYLERSF